MTAPYAAAIVGFGKMAQGYAEDPAMARHFPYATHAQVLRDHPGFDWRAVVDPSVDALAAARDGWNVPHVGTTPTPLDRQGKKSRSPSWQRAPTHGSACSISSRG